MKAIALGHHRLVEYYGCDPAAVGDRDAIRSAMLEAARLGECTIVTDVFHEFNPHGVSGVVVIAESHIAIHTWPEHRCASVDIFSCGTRMRPDRIVDFLETFFKATSMRTQNIERGLDAQELMGPPSVPAARLEFENTPD